MSEFEESALLDDHEIRGLTDRPLPSEYLNEGMAGLPVSRRMSREMALRAAYVIEMRDCSIEEVMRDPLVTDAQPVSEFSKRLIAHTVTYREQLDEVIRNKIERWEFHRVAVIDRLVLRMAVAEMLYFDDVPPKVSMNEAIEIGKKYSTENSGRFINGVLDSIYGDMGRHEKTPQTGVTKTLN